MCSLLLLNNEWSHCLCLETPWRRYVIQTKQGKINILQYIARSCKIHIIFSVLVDVLSDAWCHRGRIYCWPVARQTSAVQLWYAWHLSGDDVKPIVEIASDPRGSYLDWNSLGLSTATVITHPARDNVFFHTRVSSFPMVHIVWCKLVRFNFGLGFSLLNSYRTLSLMKSGRWIELIYNALLTTVIFFANSNVTFRTKHVMNTFSVTWICFVV